MVPLGLSVTGFRVRLLFDIGFTLRTALFRVSGTCRPHGLALGLEEESLVEEFWLSLLVVVCRVGGGRETVSSPVLRISEARGRMGHPD